jgi:hypothetical protein
MRGVADDFDISRELASALADRTAAWRFITDYAAAWQEPIRGGDGYEDEDLDAAEAQLGVRLPAALWEAYRLFGRRRDLTNIQDQLLTPESIRVREDGLVFRVENQSVMYWGLRLIDLGQPDPPVHMLDPHVPEGEQRWEPWLPTVSLTCVEMVLAETMFGNVGFLDNRELGTKDQAILDERFVRLALPPYPVSGTLPAQHWWARPDVLARNTGDWLWVLARTEQALAEVRRELPGDWLMPED